MVPVLLAVLWRKCSERASAGMRCGATGATACVRLGAPTAEERAWRAHVGRHVLVDARRRVARRVRPRREHLARRRREEVGVGEVLEEGRVGAREQRLAGGVHVDHEAAARVAAGLDVSVLLEHGHGVLLGLGLVVRVLLAPRVPDFRRDLEPPQVEQLLRDISGKAVSSEELAWVMRHADAGYTEAIECAKDKKLKLPMVRD